MDRKTGVYLCSGCSIGEAVNLDALTKVAQKEYKAPVVRTHALLCGPEGAGLIRQDLEAGTVNHVVVAACSSRAKTDVFAYGSSVYVERVNLREHVAWCQPAGHEDTQAMAEDYLRMGLVKASKAEPPAPVLEAISRRLLVVGGGLTGLTAALEAAAADQEVLLVETAEALGGFLAGVTKRFPADPAEGRIVANDIAEKVKAATYHPRITVCTSTRIVRTEGQPGMFDVTLENGHGTRVERVGAVVMATGWKPYDATKLGHLGYGASPDIVTNVEFERMLSRGRLARPSNGAPPKRVAFVQCAGSRDPNHLPYCSSVCCLATLKHAVQIREQDPDAQVFIVYKDMRTPGQYEQFYETAQNDPLTFLMKGEVSGVVPRPNGEVVVSLSESMLGSPAEIPVDLVVLATGMVTTAADGEAIRAFEDATAKAARAESETQRAEAVARAASLQQHEGTAVLRLTYRQGPDLPALKYGFPDSHFICFPYETRRTGIYAAGSMRAPMDGGRAEDDARGAALKAIQCLELVATGAAVHPRAGDLSTPNFFLQRCTQCKRCTEECPFGAIDEDEKGTPKPNPNRCRRCGICMGACPERIISFPNYSVDMMASMVKAIEVPEEDEEKPRVVVFMCENDAYAALDIVGLQRMTYDASVRVIPLRCLGSMNIVWIADALSRGIDGVLLVGCKYGDDYQCHFVKGSELANRRLENVKETLQRLKLEPERIQMTELAIDQYGTLPGVINRFMDRIREIGPNPYKGF